MENIQHGLLIVDLDVYKNKINLEDSSPSKRTRANLTRKMDSLPLETKDLTKVT